MATIAKVAEGTEVPVDGVGTYTVAGSCGGSGGRWYCVTHGEGFPNQLMKDSHIAGDTPTAEIEDPADADHVLAWLCVDHGLERP